MGRKTNVQTLPDLTPILEFVPSVPALVASRPIGPASARSAHRPGAAARLHFPVEFLETRHQEHTREGRRGDPLPSRRREQQLVFHRTHSDGNRTVPPYGGLLGLESSEQVGSCHAI